MLHQLAVVAESSRAIRALAGAGAAVAALPSSHVVDAEENCPVIYADRVYLGASHPRRLRVVCFEGASRASVRM